MKKMSNNLTKDALLKSMEQLENLTEGKEVDLEKSQICTGPGSEPKKWPGGTKVEEGNNWTDSIQPNGTDYNGSAKTRKSIMDKVEKGVPLTVEDIAFLKGDIDKANDINKSKEEDEKKKKEEEAAKYAKEEEAKKSACMGKSVEKAIENNETLQKSFEVSDFLSEFSKSFSDGIQGVEARNNESINKVYEAIGAMASLQENFNKSLAEGIASIGHGMATLMDNQEAVAAAPARGPKSESAAAAAALSKSQQSTAVIDKGAVIRALYGLMEQGAVKGLDVIKYETTEEISPANMELVNKSLGR
jgi:hypothetical protein